MVILEELVCGAVELYHITPQGFPVIQPDIIGINKADKMRETPFGIIGCSSAAPLTRSSNHVVKRTPSLK